LPDSDLYVVAPSDPTASASRIACATALRELGHALVGHAVDDAVLERVRAMVLEVLPDVVNAAPRSRPIEDMKRRLFEAAPEDGGSLEHYPNCIVSGPANPMGIALTCHRDGDDAAASVTFGAAFEGAPGRAHVVCVAVQGGSLLPVPGRGRPRGRLAGPARALVGGEPDRRQTVDDRSRPVDIDVRCRPRRTPLGHGRRRGAARRR